jgi:hypothetical protein
MNTPRPTIITVLCILTFLVSSFGLYSAISSFKDPGLSSEVSKNAIEDQFEEAENKAKSEEETKMLEMIKGMIAPLFVVENVRSMGISKIIENILTIIGAILMFGMNKKGFWIYLGGIAVSVISPMIFWGGGLGIGMGLVYGVLSILFCVLYYQNLKEKVTL